jgi:mRNA-degrading endonuclease toxin of MazEF toxin-antitoxin module
VDKPERGRIIWGDFVDPQGNDSGEHPALIITPTKDIEDGKPIRVAVISTKLQHSAPHERFELLHSPLRGGHPVTKLRKKCAVVYKWLATIKEEDIHSYAGRVYGKDLDGILRALGELP